MDKTTLGFQIAQTDTRFCFDVADIDFQQGLIIGRSHPSSPTRPDIDLHACDAYKNGVSRHHAAIFRRDMVMMLMDLGSANGTWLNDHRLFPQQPRVLQTNDSIRIGLIELLVTIRAEAHQA